MEAPNALSYTFNSVRHEVVCDVDAISGLPGVLARAGAARAMGAVRAVDSGPLGRGAASAGSVGR